MDNNEELNIKPIFRIADYVLGKYQKKAESKIFTCMGCGHQILQEGGCVCKKTRFDIDDSPKKKRGITSERQSILKEIQEIIEQERGEKINAKVFAMKLSHVKTQDLYWMKSSGLDYRNRTKQPFSKFVYGSIKPKK